MEEIVSVLTRISIASRCFLAASAVALFLYACPGSSQSLPTEQKTADVQIGGTFNYAFPDYTPQRFFGPGAYLDIDVRHHLGAEVSYSLLNNPAPLGINEKTYQYGVRYRFDSPHIGNFTTERVTPYLRLNFGRGVFNYGYTTVINPAPPPTNLTIYNADLAYNMYSMGGGIDYHLNRSINIRVIDYQHQVWFGFPPHGLSPNQFSAGAAYHFH